MKPTMTIDQVYEFLCLRDPRSPWCSERVAANPDEYPPRGRDCRCSACESGSDTLAMFTLELLGEALNNCATGLKDKNGKDIYEGDIVRYSIGDRVYVEQVAWENYGWVFLSFDGGSSSPIMSLPSLEVIGNITENPELKTP